MLFATMVSEDSHSNSNSNFMHQFILSNSISHQNQLANHHFDVYVTDSVSNNTPYPMSSSIDLVHASQPSDESDMSHDSRLIDLLGRSNEPQRLSLSLGSVPCRQRPLNPILLNPGLDYPFPSNAFNPSCNHGPEPLIGGSKYLKPAQSLLEEMVRVGGDDIDISNKKYVEKLCRKGHFGLYHGLKSELSNSDLLSDKHETHINLLKLLALLEEVERRYEEYYHHMEELVSSFEMIAGLGSGKSYTALALQAMSKHFSGLRNAILVQIRATKQRIEKDAPKISSRLSQLSLLDHESRQNRVSLQQLGILQNSRQAWRPIRGLPETSVTVLRAWLFEHFLHPYPNDSEKLMLASQTGLSKNQVSNWFINARVRLWKPMIEEMYKEEFAECSTESDQLLTREGVGDSAEDLVD